MTNDILLTGGGFANKGAEAMLKTFRDEMGKRLNTARFKVIVPADQASEARKAGFIPVNGRSYREFAAYHLGRIQRLKAIRTWAAASQADRHLVNADKCAAVFDVSGYAYADRFGSYPMQLAERFVSGCRAASIPYIFMPQAWGPLTGPFSRQAVRNVAERADLIYARDKTSFQYLSGVPEIRPDKLKLAPDIVLRFDPRESRGTVEPLERTGLLSEKSKRIGICPNIRIYNATEQEGTGRANPYVRWLVELCRGFIDETDAELILFPHEISPNWWRRDDRFVCGLVRRAFADEERVRYFANRCSADTIKLLVRNLDFLVSSRFHGIIAALSLHVPTVAVGWAHKYHELMDDADCADLAFSHESLGDGAELTKVLEAWFVRDLVRGRLTRSVPVMQEQVDRVFDRVAELLQRKVCQ